MYVGSMDVRCGSRSGCALRSHSLHEHDNKLLGFIHPIKQKLHGSWWADSKGQSEQSGNVNIVCVYIGTVLSLVGERVSGGRCVVPA